MGGRRNCEEGLVSCASIVQARDVEGTSSDNKKWGWKRHGRVRSGISDVLCVSQPEGVEDSPPSRRSLSFLDDFQAWVNKRTDVYFWAYTLDLFI